MRITSSVNHVRERGSDKMTTQRRFTISITPDLEENIEAVWKEKYQQMPYSEMIRELIRIGLNSLEKNLEQE